MSKKEIRDRDFPGLRRKGRPTSRLTVVYRARCNLCQEHFRASSRHIRFCQACRNENETFRFSEWLGRGNHQ